MNSALNDAGPNIFADADTGETQLFFTRLLNPALDDWEDLPELLSTSTEPGMCRHPDQSLSARVVIRAPHSVDATGWRSIISSVRPGLGSQDLWASTRATTLDAWSALENLGAVVNSPAFDGAPALSWDGTVLLFFSARPGGFGGNDLYVTTRSKITGK